jgi:hypothetical protein
MRPRSRSTIIATVIAATVITGAGAAVATARTLHRPPASHRVTLTNDDGGTEITVATGAVIAVRLANSSAGTAWPAPVSSDAAVVTASSSNQTRNGGAYARFTATAPGTAVISSTLQCVPDPPGGGPLCNLFPVPWEVTVHVS